MKLINAFYILLTIACTQLYAANNNLPECYREMLDFYCPSIKPEKGSDEINNVLTIVNHAKPVLIDLIKAMSDPDTDPTEMGNISGKAFYYCFGQEIILNDDEESCKASVDFKRQLLEGFADQFFALHSNTIAERALIDSSIIQKAGGKKEDAEAIYDAYVQHLNNQAQKIFDNKNLNPGNTE